MSATLSPYIGINIGMLYDMNILFVELNLIIIILLLISGKVSGICFSSNALYPYFEIIS